MDVAVTLVILGAVAFAIGLAIWRYRQEQKVLAGLGPREQVDYLIGKGWAIESQTDVIVSLTRGKPVNHLLHFFVGFFTLGAWWVFVWLPLSIFGGVKRRTVAANKWAGESVAQRVETQ